VKRLVLSGTRVGYSGAAAAGFSRRVSDFESLSAEEFGRTRAATMVSPRAPETVREAVAAVAAEVRRDGYLDGVTLLSDADNHEVLAGLGLPTLAVGGGDDVIAPPSCLQEIAAIVVGARLERIEGVAHAAYIEAPERYNALLLDFLTDEDDQSVG
jgi:pimeloyl-ACP methyl ester carboxylesterase